MKLDLSTWTDQQLVGAQVYDRRPGVHTYSDCRQGCGYAARGGGPCWRCCRAELVRRHGEGWVEERLGKP